jgi:hypothetical protein
VRDTGTTPPTCLAGLRAAIASLVCVSALAVPAARAHADEPAPRSASDRATVSARESEPVYVALVGPGRADARLTDAAIEGVARALRGATALSVLEPARSGLPTELLAGCDARVLLGCGLRAIDARLLDRDEHAVRYVLVLAIVPLSPGLRVSGLFYALDDLRAAAAEDLEGDPRAVENRLYRRSATLAPSDLPRADADAVASWLGPLVRSEVVPRLRTAAEASALGAIELSRVPPGAQLELDDRVLASPGAAGTVRVEDVRAGIRRARVIDMAGARPTIERSVVVEPGQTVRLVLEDTPRAPPPTLARGLRAGLLWSGMLAGVGGAAMLTVSAASSGGLEGLCLARSPSDAGDACRLGAVRFDRDTRELPSTRVEPVAGTGASPLGLGVLLLTTGAVWAGSAWLFDDPERVPWPELLLGAAMGIGAYGAAVALHP